MAEPTCEKALIRAQTLKKLFPNQLNDLPVDFTLLLLEELQGKTEGAVQTWTDPGQSPDEPREEDTADPPLEYPSNIVSCR